MKALLSALSNNGDNGSRMLLVSCALAFAISCFGTSSYAAITWDNEAGSYWWFDPLNWSQDEENGGAGLLPPVKAGTFPGDYEITDTQINFSRSADFNQDLAVDGRDFLTWQLNAGTTGGLSQGDANGDGLVNGDDLDIWQQQYGSELTGEGVVYDPDNDPFFANAENFPYPTGSPVAGVVGSDYGPQHLQKLYVARNTTNSVRVTIKSGDLVIAMQTIIGRSGSDAENQNLGMVVQTGGRLRIPSQSLNIGRYETSGWGNGIYEYRGGILHVAYDGDDGIKLSTDTQEDFGSGGHGRFRMGNPTTGGYVRTKDYVSSAASIDGDGVLTGVGISEFIFENGGIRPIQITRDLVINNGLDESDEEGIHSSRLELTLEEAPLVDPNGVPDILGLFQVDGIISGGGDLGNVFSNSDATDTYEEGDVISAQFGPTTYNWTITYTGDITWTDADNSVVNAILGSGSGNDVVLVGLGSAMTAAIGAVPEPGSLALLYVASMVFLGARRRRR